MKKLLSSTLTIVIITSLFLTCVLPINVFANFYAAADPKWIYGYSTPDNVLQLYRYRNPTDLNVTADEIPIILSSQWFYDYSSPTCNFGHLETEVSPGSGMYLIESLAAFDTTSGPRLISLELPYGFTSCGTFAFRGQSILTRLFIPDSVTSFYNNTFMACSSLQTLVISKDLAFMSGANFIGMRNNADVIFRGAAPIMAGPGVPLLQNSQNINFYYPDTIDGEANSYTGYKALSYYSGTWGTLKFIPYDTETGLVTGTGIEFTSATDTGSDADAVVGTDIWSDDAESYYTTPGKGIGPVILPTFISGDPNVPLEEDNLDDVVVTLTVANDTFADSTLDIANFTLSNAPAGTSIESVTYTDSTHADVALAFNGTDFDTSVAAFRITVAGEEFAKGTAATTRNMTIYAVVEPPALVTGTPNAPLTEDTLNDAVVTLSVANDAFTDSTLDMANFTLNNAPAGTSIESVTYTDPTHADVALAFNGTDFDHDVTNFSITVAGSELVQGAAATSEVMTITAAITEAITNIALSNTSGSTNIIAEATAVDSVSLLSISSASGVVIVGVYATIGGRIRLIAAKEVSVTAASYTNKVATLPINLSIPSRADKVKAFFWNSRTDIKPLMSSISK